MRSRHYAAATRPLDACDECGCRYSEMQCECGLLLCKAHFSCPSCGSEEIYSYCEDVFRKTARYTSNGGAKMSVRITFIDATGPDWLGEVDSLEEAVEDVHQHWMEVPEGAQGFVLQGGDGFILAVMIRSQADAEICLTTYADGQLEAHQCRYVRDGKGRHLQTEVVQLTRTGPEVVVR